MVISGDIFQDKVNKLLGDIEGVKAYIDEILLLKKASLRIPWKKPRICLSHIHKSGMKIKAKKCSFGLKDIPYIVCVIIM